MSRIHVFTKPDNEFEGPQLAGWFNTDSAIAYEEATRWDGNNSVSVHPVGQYGHQLLYRTKGGRWVLNTWSQWEGVQETYEFISDDTAKEWLLRNESDDAVEEWFGTLEEEAGPNLGGRPSIGPKVDFRLSAAVLERVDAFKGDRDRADALRQLVEAGLDALAPA